MSTSNQFYKPALVDLLSLTCDVDITGMATLKGVFTVKRTNSEEIVPNEEEIWINGAPSAAVASEPSPATWDPHQQLWTHTYEFGK